MLAEFSFTPAESKCLIAKAAAQMDKIKNAFENGILAMHPSSSTWFICKELSGSNHTGNVWVTGTVVPKGLCGDARTGAGSGQMNKSLADPGQYPHTVVYYKGEEQKGWTINELIEKMGPGDVYLKGVNAVDSEKVTGILLGSMVNGTIGLMDSYRKKKGYEIIVPVGYEKLIPGSVKEAANAIKGQKDYSMGIKCRMYPLSPDMVITEIEALETLAGGGKAAVFSCGGLQGAEGAVSAAFEGTEEQVNKLIEVCESVKNAVLPEVINPKCLTCPVPTCHIRGEVKSWVKE